MLRPLSPVDLPSLAYLQARVTPNEAVTRYRLNLGGGKVLPLGSLVCEWLPLRKGRHAWVLAHGGRVYGLVSIRSRLGPGVWEVDRLQVQRGREELVKEMLDGLSLVAGRMSVVKLFLRLLADSPLRAVAGEAGFGCYVRETLHELAPVPGRPRAAQPPEGLRTRLSSDEMGLFSLYNAAAPPSVRCAEGMTFQEWQGSWESPLGRQKTSELVVEREGRLVAWMKLTERGHWGLVDILICPGQTTLGEALADLAIERLVAKPRVYCLLPEFMYSLRASLEIKGFKPRNEHTLLLKQVVARARETGLIPAGA